MANISQKQDLKVIFLDFDGVLNSAASFQWEKRKKTVRICDTLSPINCSNLQFILERSPEVKLVISSTWRKLHSMDKLTSVLNAYGVESARVIGKTPITLSSDRGHEIRMWLEEHANVKEYVILDDDPSAANALKVYDQKTDSYVDDKKGHFFQTTWEDGLSLSTACKVSSLLRGEKPQQRKPVDYSKLSSFII